MLQARAAVAAPAAVQQAPAPRPADSPTPPLLVRPTRCSSPTPPLLAQPAAHAAPPRSPTPPPVPPQLTDQHIAQLPIPRLQRNGLLFVWVINAKYQFCLDLFDQWGYE